MVYNIYNKNSETANFTYGFEYCLFFEFYWQNIKSIILDNHMLIFKICPYLRHTRMLEICESCAGDLDVKSNVCIISHLRSLL